MKKEGGGRSIEERDNSLYNALKSIYEDSLFVDEVSQQWPQLPVVANLRCSLWYSPSFHSTSYFEYTDDNCLFNTSRLNLHLAHLAGQKGGCIIVDSTRRQKRFPDSLSKTIPIWTCVLNRAIAHFRRKFNIDDATSQKKSIYSSSSDEGHVEIAKAVSCDWDCSLHLPGWVSQIEKASIEAKLDEWTEQFKFKASEANIASLAACLKKPLRPLWLSQTQKSAIKLNNDSWNFTPIILVSASSWISVRQYRTTSIFWWDYIPGAGDEAETWARGLSPTLFWNHVYDLINSSPDACKQKVIDIVEKSKVPCAYIGESAPQIKIKIKPLNLDSLSYKEPSPASNISNIKVDIEPFEGLAVGASQLGMLT